MRNQIQNPWLQSDSARLVGKARHLYSVGESEKAEAILGDALNKNPRDLLILLSVGIFAAEVENMDEAQVRLNAVLQIDPRCVPALCWLSLVSLKLGRSNEASTYAAEAVRIEPSNPVTHSALARALAGQQLHAQAIVAYQKAIGMEPNNAALLYDLADSQLACGRQREGIEALRKAVLLAPEPMALLKLAFLELQFGRIEEAERFARRVLRKDPGLASAHTMLARILTEQGRGEEAEPHWQQATELEPNSSFVDMEKATALTAAGNFGEAVEALSRAIDANPVQGSAYQAFAYTKRVDSSDLPMVRKMESVLSEDDLPEQERMALLYALGKSSDNLGDFERAFEYYNQANEIRWQQLGSPNLDRSVFDQVIDAKIRLFSGSVVRETGKQGNPSSLPILVVGMMRSGTTFTEQVLSCHSKIGASGEQVFWGEREADVVDYRRQTIDRGKLKTYAGEYVQLLSSIAPGFSHVIDKNPGNLQLAGLVNMSLPNARVIHVRRNPVDTAISIWTTPMNTGAEFFANKANIVTAMKGFRRLTDHWGEVLPADRYMEVRYEDLVTDPENNGRRIVEFLGLEWEEACLYPERNDRRVITPSLWQVRQPIFRTSMNRWKNFEPWLGEFAELQDLA